MGCVSACLIQQEHKGPATLVCTLDTLKELSGGFCGEKVRGVRGELMAGSLQRESDTGLWLRLQGRYLAWSSLIAVMLYVWQQLRAAGLFCRCVLVYRGTCSWNNFRAELERMKGRKAPAGEM